MKLDYCEAIARLEALPFDCLAEWCYDSYKDFYGIKGRHMKGQGWTKLDYLDWIKCHFLWDYDAQGWRNAVPFVEED